MYTYASKVFCSVDHTAQTIENYWALLIIKYIDVSLSSTNKYKYNDSTGTKGKLRDRRWLTQNKENLRHITRHKFSLIGCGNSRDTALIADRYMHICVDILPSDKAIHWLMMRMGNPSIQTEDLIWMSRSDFTYELLTGLM